MGKRAREKRERRLRGEKRPRPEKEEGSSSIFLRIIRWGTYLILFTPLILSGKYFFPFVGPKSLYFMALAQIIFFAWLLLIISNPKYRPRLNALSIALVLFLLVFILSAFLGEDFSRSFWSKYERMTGVLMWFHLFAFFLVISTTFRKWADWSKIFSVSIFAAILISIISLFAKAGVDLTGLGAASRGGATIGNSSFMGTYLLFNIFLALYLITRGRQSRTKGEDEATASLPLKSAGGLRIYLGISLPIMLLAVYLSGAKAATYSVVAGLVLLFLLYLIFACQKRYLNILGKVGLAGIVIVSLISAFYLFQPDNIIHNWFVEKATYARLVVWQGSWQGFLERPVLGWGPENFELVFTRHFHPCLFLRECGGEIWFDRAHNIVLDTLVANGILGLLAYFGIFLSVFYVLWRRYFLKNSIDFWTAGIFSVTLIAYSIQNLTVFDMINSYLMFFLVLGFVGGLTGSGPGKDLKPGVNSVKKGILAVILIFFIFSFFKFVVQPTKANRSVIDTIRVQSPDKRALLGEKTLKTSPLGKYQIREMFADRAISFSQSEEAKSLPAEEFKTELDFLSQELEESRRESPLDFRAYLKLGRIYNLYSRIDPEKLPLAEEVLKKAIELSPTNQQGYWELAQTRAFQGNFQEALVLAEKTVELEPRVFNSHLIVIQVAKMIGDNDLIAEKIKEAIEINPEWEAYLTEQF